MTTAWQCMVGTLLVVAVHHSLVKHECHLSCNGPVSRQPTEQEGQQV
jgi:hypothetical protein